MQDAQYLANTLGARPRYDDCGFIEWECASCSGCVCRLARGSGALTTGHLERGYPTPVPCPAHRHVGQVGRNTLRPLAAERITTLYNRSAIARYQRRSRWFIDQPKHNDRSATRARPRRRPNGSVRRRPHGNGLGHKSARPEECDRNVYTKHGRYLNHLSYCASIHLADR